ncbi:hypothetical protein DDB_G0275121 [Dictyostelium discoideum AX4]|uniref:Lysozyme C n=1 Tax=Dictyostelium discoideum TaxID=44689 RepID=LYSC_DICDI|nr:hypothetical protein DDB_G0275121 [Dictyostelium discoideum AX4]Q8T1G5.1 RecName: Full=Lysozyme C; AltName: Full=1,4-beta-N-acetylmuramidase C; Flags: Precursor [Dictyostelium discoideum]EAL69841.1 hypothetical protein DDB_G0275121 [Dictyostelium discoideum AX4]|eukprot:XP_643740.1 hypothetical protein DDB_G0275121 [Dictyostelium discoideum AX4]
MRIAFFLLILSIIVGLAYGYSCPKPCYGNMCCSTSPDHKYYLTDFCGSTSACGPKPSCSGKLYFTADSQRFGCGKHLNLCRGKKCVKAKVYDAGPAEWVEKDAGKMIIDASPTICHELTGGSSCGWSDKFEITATVTSLTDSRPLGPFNVTEEEMDQLFIDHEIAMAQCEAEKTCNGFDLE